jgi:Cdc6-like AAA superfamily ATPase
MAEPDPAAWVAASRDRLEQDILRLALTEASVASGVHGDLRRALKALEAVLKQAADWEAERGHPLSERAERTSLLFAAKYARVDAGVEIREAITSKLLSEGESDAQD